MTQVLKNRKGVTLVELLAVIVIMGIIAAIAVPAIGGLIKNAEEKAVIGDLTSLTEAARMYSSVNEDDTSVTGAELETAKYITLNYTEFETLTFTISNGSVSAVGPVTIGSVTYVYDGNWEKS